MTFSYAKCRVNLLCLNISLSLDESHAGQLVELRGEPLLGRRGRVPSRPHLSNRIYAIDFEHYCDWSDINEETDITTVIGRTKKKPHLSTVIGRTSVNVKDNKKKGSVKILNTGLTI